MDINNLITNFGFPITACVVMGFFIYQLVLTNQSSISNMDLKINVIEDKVNTIADKIK